MDVNTTAHEHDKPCPITGREPVDFIWTDHKREGCYNSCAYCHSETKPLSVMLQELKERRINNDGER